MDTNFPILGPVAQHGQSAGLLIQWSRDRSPSGPLSIIHSRRFSVYLTFLIIYLSSTQDAYNMKDVELRLESLNIKPHEIIKGKIQVNYSGRYDGIVVNTQILNSNQLIVYRSYSNKAISQNLSRLFINRNDIPKNMVEFTASIEFEPKETHEVKFRVSIIQEHKEIESDVLFAKLVP